MENESQLSTELAYDSFLTGLTEFISRVGNNSFFSLTQSIYELCVPITSTHTINEFSRGNNEVFAETHLWNPRHDNILSEITLQYKNDWKKISRRIETLCEQKFSPAFLRERMKTIKKDDLNKYTHFKKNEDKLLLESVKTHGFNWNLISGLFPRRDAINLKNRYYYLKRKRPSKSSKNSQV